MRIAYITTSNVPDPRANTCQSLKMCEAFSRCGCDVTMVFPFRFRSVAMARQMPDFWEGLGLSPPPFRLRAIPVFDLAWVSAIGLRQPYDALYARSHRFQWLWFAGTYGSFAALAAAFVMLRQARFDLVYARSDWVLSALGSLRPRLRIPVAFELHHIGTLARTLRRVRKADRVISNTRAMSDVLIANGFPPARISVEPSGVDLDRFSVRLTREEARHRLGLPPETPIIGYVGRFRAMGMEKGIPELVEAMAGIPDTPRGAPMLLCVGGPLESLPLYYGIAARHGVAPERLRFVDHVPHVEVPLWIRACDVATIPWPWTPFSAYATSPLKMFEYMAAGTPILASDLPSLREILRHGENAWLVEPGSPLELAAGVRRLLESQSLAAALAERAAADVGFYAWQARARRILDLIEADRRALQPTRS